MSDHSSSVFNNSCLKLPRNPKNKYPLPLYEQKYLNQLQNQATKLELEGFNKNTVKPTTEKDRIRSFIEFFDSIPEYDDINHLSNKEFYKKLEVLKEKQRSYADYVQNENKLDVNKSPLWLEEYKEYAKKINIENSKDTAKPFCVTPILSKSPKYGKSPDEIGPFSLSDKEIYLKPSSRRSVRIETPSDKLSPGNTPDFFRRPKSRLPSASSKGLEEWDNESTENYKLDLDDLSPLQSKSVPNSPNKSKPSVGWKDNNDGITIPKPFEMTVRLTHKFKNI